MSKNLVLEAFTNEQLKTEVPSFNVGDTVKVRVVDAQAYTIYGEYIN